MTHGFLLDSGTGHASGAPAGENWELPQTELVWRLVHVSVLLKSGALPVPTWVQIFSYVQPVRRLLDSHSWACRKHAASCNVTSR